MNLVTMMVHFIFNKMLYVMLQVSPFLPLFLAKLRACYLPARITQEPYPIANNGSSLIAGSKRTLKALL